MSGKISLNSTGPNRNFINRKQVLFHLCERSSGPNFLGKSFGMKGRISWILFAKICFCTLDNLTFMYLPLVEVQFTKLRRGLSNASGQAGHQQ